MTYGHDVSMCHDYRGSTIDVCFLTSSIDVDRIVKYSQMAENVRLALDRIE